MLAFANEPRAFEDPVDGWPSLAGSRAVQAIAAALMESTTAMPSAERFRAELGELITDLIDAPENLDIVGFLGTLREGVTTYPRDNVVS